MVSEFFGHRPERPTNPEFWQLCEVILQMDAKASEKDGASSFQKIVEEIIPTEVLAYVAGQRSAAAISQAELAPTLAIAMGTWVDGFIAGAIFSARYPKESP